MNVISEEIEKVKPYSYLINFFIFVFKIILFILTKSFSFIISAFYNLGFGFAKKYVNSKDSNYIKVGFFIIFASICFIINSIWIVCSHEIVNYNLYTGISIATVTFFDIGYSIVSIVKNKSNHKYYVLKLISLATALISLELTQSALLSFTMVGVDTSLYNGIIGIIVGLCSMFIGVIIIRKVQLNKL